eukprot:CAMPEP_0181211420 /NCGR_PEP_ID=MMETSP1096-20121128/23773_1 /TAXON_ID=156174 ORGANISM="Chrysochromulina ericina, Strain CCMP281" /NCGR_SAMPLE_ID=MMETSP1096 /ASSEMBLY_ACC=CAM_ASM_000453 /LENGTH=194 /DNA_ID=CAMNT_0023302813 /DNA_START=588 /DNA_END=1169 /DNA_ORIENTATION=+
MGSAGCDQMDGISWDGIYWDGISWDGISWEGIYWDGISCEGISWSTGMRSAGWDQLGWEQLGWDLLGCGRAGRRVYARRRCWHRTGWRARGQTAQGGKRSAQADEAPIAGYRVLPRPQSLRTLMILMTLQTANASVQLVSGGARVDATLAMAICSGCCSGYTLPLWARDVAVGAAFVTAVLIVLCHNLFRPTAG